MENSNPFIVCVEGRLPLEFGPNEDFLEATLINPCIVSNICIMLTQPIPEDKACKKPLKNLYFFNNTIVCLYYSVHPFTDVEFMTAVANMRPTDIVATNFPLKSNIQDQSEIKIIV